MGGGHERGQESWRCVLWRSIDDIYGSDDGIPPGAVGVLSRALDAMRSASDRAERPHVEAFALMLHEFRHALLTTGPASPRVASLRRELHRSASAWLQDAPLAAFA